MIAKFDDFTKRELQTMLNATVSTMTTLESNLKNHEYIDDEVIADVGEELIHLQKFRIALLNAIGIVGVREEIAQN